METINYFEVHAFATDYLGGNPAGVCLMDAWIEEKVMQSIAASNNLSETAFIVPYKEEYRIRYFTPNQEVALCGHATLASAWVLFQHNHNQRNPILFHSSGGKISVSRKNDHLQMSLPSLSYYPIDTIPEIVGALNISPKETYVSTYDLLFIYQDAYQIENIVIDRSMLENFTYRGIIITAPAEQTDIYSRCFYPGCDIFEDPVTGSAHAVLAPYWCNKLNKKTIHAEQGFRRRGRLFCEVIPEHVLIEGQCKLFLEGLIYH